VPDPVELAHERPDEQVDLAIAHRTLGGVRARTDLERHAGRAIA